MIKSSIFNCKINQKQGENISLSLPEPLDLLQVLHFFSEDVDRVLTEVDEMEYNMRNVLIRHLIINMFDSFG